MSEKKNDGVEARAELTRGAVRRFVAGLEPDSLELAFTADPELTRQTFMSVPEIDMALVRVTRIICEYLGGLGPAERSEVLEAYLSRLDGSQLAAATNAWSELAMRLHEERPDLLETVYPQIDAVFRETDFGKGREALTAALDYFTATTVHSIEVMMENPVVVANIVGIVPPLVNSLMKIVSVALEKTNLPPEILASALFNTMSALDAEELGRLLTTASKMAIDLHAGNYILGGEEPRFRAVFSDFMKRVLDNVDYEAATGATVALAEDLEVMAGVMVELVARDPEMVVLSTRMGARLQGVIARVLSSSLAEMAAWPDELLVRVGEEMAAADTVELGRAIDSAVTLAIRMRENNPDLHKRLLAGALQGVNTERLELCVSAAATDLKEALLENQGIRQALEPEEMGRRINEALVRFNSSPVSRPGAISDYVVRLLAVVDTGELDRAARTVSHGMMDAVLATKERVRMLLKLGASNLWRAIRLVAGALTR